MLDRYEWDWFATLTPRDLPSNLQMVTRFNKLIRAIQQEEKKLVGYYMVTEQFKSRKSWHMHALLGNLIGASRSRWWHWWFFRYGAARILPYQSGLGASSYLTKYVSKEASNYGSVHIKNLGILDKVNSQGLTN